MGSVKEGGIIGREAGTAGRRAGGFISDATPEFLCCAHGGSWISCGQEEIEGKERRKETCLVFVR